MSKLYLSPELPDIVATSTTLAEVFKRLGYNSRGGITYMKMIARIKELGLNMDHFTKSGFKPANIEEICVVNSTYSNTSGLKAKLLKENLIVNSCACCGLSGTWNGKPISLQLDHINGTNDDNRLCNLRLLCPNCHSQTDTYAGKNKSKR